MSSYDSMRGKLQPLRLYTLAPGSETDHELHAYAAGLDPMFHELTVAAREAFIQTAESYGLSEREKFSEKEKAELSAASRRELLLGSEQPYDERTPSGFQAFLENICGLAEAHFQEHPSRERLDIYIDDVLESGRKRLVGEKIKRALPCDQTGIIHFRDGSSISV